MLLSVGNQVKNLPLTTNPSSMSLMPRSLGRVCGSVREKPHCKLAPMTELLSFIEKLLVEQVIFLTFVFPSCVRGVLLHCVPQSSEANAKIKRGWFRFFLTTCHKATETKGLRMAQWFVSPALCQNKLSTQVDKRKESEELCQE